MLESGLINHWHKEIWPSINQCESNEKNYTLRTLKLQDMLSPFLIWGLGLTLALTCFIFENIANFFIHLTKKL